MRLRLTLLSILLLALFASPCPADQELAVGDAFPEVALPTPPAAADRSYLGLGPEEFFSASQVGGELLLVELLNVHCPHCQMQSASYNELYKLIEADPHSRGKIRMLAIAVGNVADEVSKFRSRYQVAFPILPDPGFAAWRAMGGSGTPLSIYVRQTEPGQPGVVAETHLGLNTHYQQIFGQLKELAVTTPQTFRTHRDRQRRIAQALKPLFSEPELESRVRSAMTAVGGGIVDFTRIKLPSGRRVYAGLMQQGDQRQVRFAEVVSRLSVCDICHDVHFIYLFDPGGRITGFQALQLTRYGNVNWNPQQIETMRRRLVGTRLGMPPVFDPKVDAITSATITSAIIFDSLSSGPELLKELDRAGWLSQ